MDIFGHVLWMADGGAGSGAGVGGGAAPAASDGGMAEGQDAAPMQDDLPHLQPRRKAKENPLASVQYGRQPMAQQEVTQQAPAQEKASFDDLIKGEYKQEYEKRLQSTLAERLKGRDADRQKAEQMEPILAALAHKYGKDAQDLAGIAQAVQDDNSLFEDEANQMGVPVEVYKNMKTLETENQRMKAEQQRNAEESALRQHYQRLATQAEEMKQAFPGFDLQAELQNPLFMKWTSPQYGMSVKDAYFAIHHDEIQKATMQYAGQRATQQIAASVQAGARRPQENGMQGVGAALIKSDPSTWSKADRDEVRRRVRNGEDVFL